MFVYNLLLLAEELKSGRLPYPMCFAYFGKNDEAAVEAYNFRIMKITIGERIQNKLWRLKKLAAIARRLYIFISKQHLYN